MKIKLSVLLLICVFFMTSSVFARNPIVKYFAHLLDETKAEVAIGTLIRECFFKEIKGHVEVREDISLTVRMQNFVANSQRPEVR